MEKSLTTVNIEFYAEITVFYQFSDYYSSPASGEAGLTLIALPFCVTRTVA
ncbi:hypothetical protein [Algoriphagus sp. NG3]|uniref:hypothetical protein n=1 Tax=unclassified Algoriphagus TaxID=2641541 RepID=UPI002A8399DC|nr:hypothetical protein [Algoriphagus sp. NG3]WPR76714.1 hypothetical protein SLW71_05090 [Algoriphagus sp. NG3]